MGINVIITDRKFFSEIRNGSSFGSHTSDFTTNLAGSVMEKMKLVQTVQVSWEAIADNSSGFYFIAAGQVQRYTGSFIDDGFAIGDIFDFNNVLVGSATTYFSGTITAISSDGLNMYYTVSTGTDQTSNSFAYPACFRGKTTLKSLSYKFGIIENNETTNFIHKATGKEQSYTFKDLTASTTGEPSGGVNIWETGSITCSTGSFSGTYYQTFTITHYFIQPYYAPGYELDYDPVTQPAEYAGTNSLKYICAFDFRAVYSNPNGAKLGVDDKNLGSTAFFDENFNGLPPGYSIASIGFIDSATSDVLTGIQKEGKTSVTAIVNGTFASGDHNFGVYISKAPATVGNLADSFTDLFIEANITGVTDAGAVAGSGIITNYEAVTDGGGTFITVTFDIEFNSDQKARIVSGDYFLIGLQAVDNSLSNAASDKVTLVGAYRPYVVNNDVAGLLIWRDNRYYNHLQAYPDTSPGGTGSYHDFKGWIEDGLVNNFNFDLDLSKDADLFGLKGQLIAYNTTTEEYWEIQSYTFNTNNAQFAPVGGYTARRINFQTHRDFNLPSGDQFKLIRLWSADDVRNVSWYNYDAVITWKIDWQKWIPNPNVNAAFYNTSELLYNKNQHASNYSQINAGGDFWELRFLYTATINSSGNLLNTVLTDYQLLSPRLVIRDYLKDGNTPPKWTPTITTWIADGSQQITPKILTNAPTLFKITWVYDVADYGTMGDDFSDFAAIHRIEPHYIPGSYAIEELSSIRLNLAQKLKGVAGKTSPHQTKITINTDNVVTECLIDHTQLNPALNYKLSGRLFAEGETIALTWDQITTKWEDITSPWEIL